MKKVFIICNAFIIGLLVVIVILSLNIKKYDKEYMMYTLKTDYSLCYDDTRTFTIKILSNTCSESILYSEKNVYALCDYNENFYYNLDLENITECEIEGLKSYDFKFKIPSLNEYYVKNCFLKVTNDTYTYKGSIGSLYVTDKYRILEQLDINKIGGNFINNNLNTIEIEMSESLEVDDVISGDNIKCTYKVEGRSIIVSIDESNYLSNTFFVIKSNESLYLVPNYYYGLEEITIEKHYRFLSPLARFYNDSI